MTKLYIASSGHIGSAKANSKPEDPVQNHNAASSNKGTGWPFARLDAVYGDLGVRHITIDLETRPDDDASGAIACKPDGNAPVAPVLYQIEAVSVFVSLYSTPEANLPSGFRIRTYTRAEFPERDLLGILAAEISHADSWHGFAWELHEIPVLLARAAIHGLNFSTVFSGRNELDLASAGMKNTIQLGHLCSKMGIPSIQSGGTDTIDCSPVCEARATALWLLESRYACDPDIAVTQARWALLAGWISSQPRLDHLRLFVTASPQPPVIPRTGSSET